MKIRSVLAGLAAVVTISIGGVLLSVNAQQPGAASITISPFRFDNSTNPGESFSNRIRVTNNAETDRVVDVAVRNFTAAGEEGGVELTEEATSYSVASWISVDKQSATIPAGESEFFQYTVDVPLDAEPGGHYGSILFQTVSDETVAGTGANIGQEVGALQFVTVAGDVTRELDVASFEADGDFYNQGPVEFVSRFENTGSVHIKPTGKIEIKNMFGQVVETLNIEARDVLPDSIRKLTTEWDPGLSTGRYTATLSATYADGSDILTASSDFILFPYKVITPIAVGAIVALYVAIRYRDRFGRAFRALSGKE